MDGNYDRGHRTKTEESMIGAQSMETIIHCKKRLSIFPSPAWMSLTKLSLAGNNIKVHKIDNFFDSDFGICVISLLVMHK